MASEFVLLNTTRELNKSELESSLHAFNEPVPKGFHNARWGKIVNEPQSLVGLFTWDTVEDHINFATSPRFASLEAAVKPWSKTWPPHKMFHVHFEQGLPALDVPFAELVTLQPKDGISWDPTTFKQSLESFVRIASQHGLRAHYNGTMHEEPNTFVILFKWESSQARETTQISNAWEEFLKSASPAERKTYLITL